MVKYILIDLREELDCFNKNYRAVFGRNLASAALDELIHQMFDVFLNYGIRQREATDATVISHLSNLPNPDRFDIALFIGNDSESLITCFKDILFGLAISIYEKLKEFFPMEKEFNFVIRNILHTQGQIVIEFFNY